MEHLAVVKEVNADIIDLRSLLHELVANKHIILIVVIISIVLTSVYNILTVPKYSGDVLIRIQDSENANVSSFAFTRSMFSDNKNETRYSALLRSRYILTPTIHQLGLNVIARPDKPLIASAFSNHDHINIKQFIVPPDFENKSFKIIIDAPQHFQLLNHNKLVLEGAMNQFVQTTDGAIALEIKAWQANIGSRFIITKYSDEKIIKNLAKHLQIRDLGSIDEKNEKTGILQVSYVDENPNQLVDILNTAVNILQQKNIKQKSAKAEDTLLILQKQMELAKKSLENAETAYNNYRTDSKKLDIKAESKFLLHQRAEIDKQLTKLHLSRRALLLENTSEHPFISNLDEKSQSLLIERKEIESKLALLPAYDQASVRLTRDIKTKQNLYLILLKKIQALKIEYASIMSDIQILSYAQLPYSPLPQYPWLISLAGAIVGFVLSCIIIFFRKMLFSKVNNPYWGEQHLDLPTLAIIPFSQRQKNLHCKKILAREHRDDVTLEILRSLRTSLQAILCRSPNNIISVMGLIPQIGKSFIAVNLAYLLAEGGKRVVLIDGDLRGGRLHEYLDVPRTPGFSNLINDTHTLEQALHGTAHKNLSLLPTGTYSFQPSELLMKQECEKWINALALQYDIVIIDTAPILTVTDAAIISRLAGINFLVLGADLHQSAEIKMAVKRLSYANVKLHGVIYNHLKKAVKMAKRVYYND